MTNKGNNQFDNLLENLKVNGQTYRFYDLKKLNDQRYERLPISIKVLLEAAVRNCDNFSIKPADIEKILDWKKSQYATENDIPFKPARVLLQDLTGVAVVVDFAGMRDAYAQLGGQAERINPLCQVDLVVDHSVQVDFAKTADSLQKNQDFEFERNKERFRLFKWATKSMNNFRIIPPGSGIVHQINLEYLAHVVYKNEKNLLYPDSLVGADSHTVMINGLGIVGYGCGGIECEAVMLGQILSLPIPQVVGYKLTGKLDRYATSTDLVLTITKHLRSFGVIGMFIEFFGPGLAQLSLADRATIANMCPEYGATVAFFPVDDKTISYLKQTGRDAQLISYVEKYLRSVKMFRNDFNDISEDPEFSQVLELDLSTVTPSVSGPKRPHDRVPFNEFKQDFLSCLSAPVGFKGFGFSSEQLNRGPVPFNYGGQQYTLEHGSVVIAAITSCTNTSNPSVMLGAGLLAKKAVERNLSVKPYIKTSLSPGSGVVTYYLKNSGVLPYLEKLGFYVVGYGCQTCIGNSGPLEPAVVDAIKEADLVTVGVLSGNRNFEGRVHPMTRANYLASPLIVVACAIAGKVIDFEKEPLGTSDDGTPVFLRDIWPTKEEIEIVEQTHVVESMFREVYENIEKGNKNWSELDAPKSLHYPWEASSDYLKKPFFYDNVSKELNLANISKISNARVLLHLGDSISTDMISPAGAISRTSPAYRYLTERGVKPKDINSYGSYRGNDAVMIRGTFANIRLSNKLLGSVQKPRTLYFPTNEELDVYDASIKYKESGTPLIIIAGKEYGCGSSRDWAAKGAVGLGIKAVIAESYERIHRSNLIGMSILPLQFLEGENSETLKLTGRETYTIDIGDKLSPRQRATVYVEGGAVDQFHVEVRFDTEVEIEYYKHGVSHSHFERMRLVAIITLLILQYAILAITTNQKQSDETKRRLVQDNDIVHATDLSKGSDNQLSPIILMPGDGGSRLQAKLDRHDVLHHYCERKSKDWFDLWINLSLLVPFAIDCWVDNMKLIYNSTTRKTHNSPGVSIRVGGFGKSESVEFVDPAKVPGTSYFDTLVRQLVALGYERNKNILGAPYDFRRAPNELHDYFDDLKRLVERAYEENDNERIVFICHSMGCLNSQYFLKSNTQAWKDKYIRSMISLSGVWGGSVKALKAFASGDNFGVLVIPSLSLRKDVRTFPSLAYLLPSKEIFPEDTVLVKNRDKKYTVNDYQQFFKDIDHPVGYEMWLDVRNLTSPLSAPGVEVHCLHGNKVTTMEHLDYQAGDFPDAKPRVTYGDGDGTVNLMSLQACIGWAEKQKQPLYYKNFTSIDHMTILTDTRVLDYIGEALSKKP